MNPYIYLHTFNFKSEIFTFEIKFGIKITNFFIRIFTMYRIPKNLETISLSLINLVLQLFILPNYNNTSFVELAPM